MLRNRRRRAATRTLLTTTALAAAVGPVAIAAEPVVLTGQTSPTTLPTWQDRYDWPQGHGSVGWDTRQPAGGGYTLTTDGADPGLWAAPLAGRHPAPASGSWAFSAPGTTRIATATVELEYAPRVLSHHCVRVALEAAAGEPDVHEFCHPPGPVAGTGAVEVRLADPAPNPTSTILAVSLVLPCDKPNPGACAKQVAAADAIRDSLHVRVVDRHGARR